MICGASAHITLARTSRVALPYSCALKERGTGLMNTCNVSHMVNMEYCFFFFLYVEMPITYPVEDVSEKL